MPLTAEQALSWVNKLYDRIGQRQSEIDKFDRYYRGEQPLAMASDIWREFHEQRYARFADNWCGVVADAPAQRLRPTGVRLDDAEEFSAAERSLWSDWQRGDMDRQAAQGLLETIKSRRSFVLVWPDSDGNPVPTWEDPTQVAVAYNPERPRERVAALKVWVDDKVEYATLYDADHLWKFQRTRSHDAPRLSDEHSRLWRLADEGGWEPREVANETWPLRNPLGVVPVVEVRNRGPLRGDPLSEIGGVVPMQDAINLLWAYLFTSADHASFPARVIMGADAPQIPVLASDGTVSHYIDVDLKSLANGRLLFLNNEDGTDAKIDQWDAAKLDVFTDVIEVAVGHIAAQTRTPQHYLILGRNANPAAAEALTAAEAGLNAKVHDLKLFMGPDLREVLRLFALVRGDSALADMVRGGRLVWEDSENRSEAQRADAATKWAAVGVSRRGLIERYFANGDPNETQRQMDMIADEANDPAIANLLAKMDAMPARPNVTQVAGGEPSVQ